MSKSQQTPDKLIEFVLWPCLRSSGKVCMCNMSLSNRRRFYCLFALTFLPPKNTDKNTALLRCATVIQWPCWKEGSAQDAGGTCSSTFGTQRYQAEALILVQQHDNMFRHVCDNDLYRTEVQEDLLLRQMPPIRLDLDFLWTEVILWNPLPAYEVVSPVSIGQYLANCTISVAALQINVFAWHLLCIFMICTGYLQTWVKISCCA